MPSIHQAIGCVRAGVLVALIALPAGAVRGVPITHAFEAEVHCWGHCAPDGNYIYGMLRGTYTFDSEATPVSSRYFANTTHYYYAVQMHWEFGVVVADGPGEISIGNDGDYDGFLADFYFGYGPAVYFYAIDCTASMFDRTAPPVNLELKLGGFLPGCSVGEGFHLYNEWQPLPGLYFEGYGGLAKVARVPAPGTLVLLGVALAGLGFARQRKVRPRSLDASAGRR